jgi:hypothetical protein
MRGVVLLPVALVVAIGCGHIPASTAPVTAAQPIHPRAPEAAGPVNVHELLPGETVTVIPGNSGPSPGPAPSDDPS